MNYSIYISNKNRFHTGNKALRQSLRGARADQEAATGLQLNITSLRLPFKEKAAIRASHSQNWQLDLGIHSKLCHLSHKKWFPSHSHLLPLSTSSSWQDLIFQNSVVKEYGKYSL